MYTPWKNRTCNSKQIKLLCQDAVSDDYRMEETKIMKFERDYSNNLEYTFFNLFPQNLSAVQVGYDASKILTASCAFEYTRYVCGPISNISKYRSGGGYNNITIADIKERLQSKLMLQDLMLY